MLNLVVRAMGVSRPRGGGRRGVPLLLLLAFSFAPVALALDPGVPAPAGFRDDRIIVRAADHANPGAVQRLHATLGTSVFRHFTHARAGEVVKLPRGLGVAAAVAAFQRSGLVDYAEPDFLLKPLFAPNDFQYVNQDQWNLHNTGIYGGVVGADVMAEPAWDLQREATNIIVAVVDTGIRYTHEDLAPNMWVNPGETGTDALGRDKRTNGIDDDGDGYVDDVYGINVLNGSGNPWDDWGHGTHVAGIVGAVGNNSVGIAGIAWKVKLMAVKFIDANSNYSISDAITALDYARRNGARIITASWGNYAFNSTAFQNAMAALRDAGIIVTAAAGNDNNNNDVMALYPASYGFDNIISVAATTRTDDRASYSNYGAHSVHLGAPGSPVFSTWAGNDHDYRYYEGTSMAAPHLAGACALLWTRFPGDTYPQIIQRILSTVEVIPSMTGVTRTNGRLNLAAALATGSATPPPAPAPPPAPTGLSATATSSSTINLAWTDNSSTEIGFEVQRSTDNVNFASIATVGANATTATASGLSASTAYFFRVSAVQNGTPSAFSNTAAATTTASSPPPPSGTWMSADVGSVAASGSTSESGGTVTVTGSGADIWDAADEFQYRYQSWTGDGQIVARVTSLTNTNGWAKACLMFRETLAANSRHAMMCVSATNGTALQRRVATGGTSASTSGTGGSSLPRWLRLVRSGSTLTGYESGDGVTWSAVGTVTVDLPATILVGLAVTSHNDGVLCSATFDNVALAGGSTPPPSATWSQTDIGNVGVAGSNDASGNTITVRGSGADVWDTADAFRFVYQQISDDCTVDTQVSSLSNTQAWAKAGVMIRESLAANARNVFAFLTPANGVSVQIRQSTGGTTTANGGSWWVTAPYWVRLVRAGTRITAYQSADGVNWTQVVAYDIALNASAYVGLAVTSHGNTQLNTAVFTNPGVR